MVAAAPRAPWAVPGHQLPVRFIREIGVLGKLRIYWDRVRVEEGGRLRNLDECPKSYGEGRPGIHKLEACLGEKP